MAANSQKLAEHGMEDNRQAGRYAGFVGSAVSKGICRDALRHAFDNYYRNGWVGLVLENSDQNLKRMRFPARSNVVEGRLFDM